MNSLDQSFVAFDLIVYLRFRGSLPPCNSRRRPGHSTAFGWSACTYDLIIYVKFLLLVITSASLVVTSALLVVTRILIKFLLLLVVRHLLLLVRHLLLVATHL